MLALSLNPPVTTRTERRGLNGRVRLDDRAHALVCGADRVYLTPTEYRLLDTLATEPGEVLRRRDLVDAAWAPGAIVHDNTLDVYMSRLRRKLRTFEDAPAISTVHGTGYRLDD